MKTCTFFLDVSFFIFIIFGFGPQLRVRVSGCYACRWVVCVFECAFNRVLLSEFFLSVSRFQRVGSVFFFFFFFQKRLSMCVCGYRVRRIIVTSVINTSVYEWVCFIFVLYSSSFFFNIRKIFLVCAKSGIFCFPVSSKFQNSSNSSLLD